MEKGLLMLITMHKDATTTPAVRAQSPSMPQVRVTPARRLMTTASCW